MDVELSCHASEYAVMAAAAAMLVLCAVTYAVVRWENRSNR
jgi:hypothetical protein